MTLQEFENKYLGKPIDFDGWYGDQCVDEMNQYLLDVCGIQNPIQTFPGQTAFDIYQNANDARFNKIDNDPNDPNQVPLPGAIMFWKANVAGVTGSAGHVAIFKSGQAGENKFTSIDQNYPTGTLVHEQVHTYDGVVGWLQLKNQVQTVTLPQKDLDEIRLARDTNYNNYQDALKSINTLNAKIEELGQTIQKDARDDHDLGIKLLEQGQSYNDLIKALGLPQGATQQQALDTIVGLKKPHDEVVKQVVPVMNKLADAAIYKRVPTKTSSFATKLNSFINTARGWLYER